MKYAKKLSAILICTNLTLFLPVTLSAQTAQNSDIQETTQINESEKSTETNAADFSSSDSEAEKKSKTAASENSSTTETQITSNPDLKITKINFTGLKKTRSFYIQSKVKKFIGKQASEETMHDLETAVQLEGLFDDIKISLAPSETDSSETAIEVSVKEKITFIPIPFAMYSGSGFACGGIVMDTNAAGIKNMVMVGGFYSSSSLTGIAAFSKAPTDSWIPGYSVFGSISKNTPKYVNLENDTVLKFQNFSYSVSLSLSEKLGNYNSVSISGQFKSCSTDDKDNYISPESYKSGSIGLNWGISKSDWNGWFMSSNNAGISLEEEFSNRSDYSSSQSVSANIAFQQPLIPRLRLYSRISGYYGWHSHIASYQKREAASVTILPSDFYSERLCGGNTGLECAVFKGKIGTISIYGDYQAAYVQDFDEDYEFVQGFNTGMRLYLAKVAFPALAMGLSYNVTKHYWQYAAAMGMNL